MLLFVAFIFAISHPLLVLLVLLKISIYSTGKYLSSIIAIEQAKRPNFDNFKIFIVTATQKSEFCCQIFDSFFIRFLKWLPFKQNWTFRPKI